MSQFSSPLPFSFEGRELRVLHNDAGDLLFVAKDVAVALGYTSTNTKQLIEHVPTEWKGSNRIATPGGEQTMLTLTEQGLYFFLGRSDKPKALPFQKWLAGDGPLRRAFRTGRGFAAFRGYAFRGSAARQRKHAQDVPPHPASDGRHPARQDAGGTGAAGGGAVRQALRHGGDPEGQGRGQRPLPALGQGAPHPFRQPRAGQEALHRLCAVVL